MNIQTTPVQQHHTEPRPADRIARVFAAYADWAHEHHAEAAKVGDRLESTAAEKMDQLEADVAHWLTCELPPDDTFCKTEDVRRLLIVRAAMRAVEEYQAARERERAKV